MATHRLAALIRAARSAASTYSTSHGLGTPRIGHSFACKQAGAALAVAGSTWCHGSVAGVHTCSLAPMNTREVLLRSLFDEFSTDGVHVDHESMHTVSATGAGVQRRVAWFRCACACSCCPPSGHGMLACVLAATLGCSVVPKQARGLAAGRCPRVPGPRPSGC